MDMKKIGKFSHVVSEIIFVVLFFVRSILSLFGNMVEVVGTGSYVTEWSALLFEAMLLSSL